MDSVDIGVGELITAIRQELAAQELRMRSMGAESLFDLQTVQLDVSFNVTRHAEGTAGIDLKVVSVGGTASKEASEVQQISLVYKVNEEAKRRFVPGARAHGTSASYSIDDEVEPLE